MDTSTSQNNKQGFRFYKSGSTSPVPNPPHRVTSNPSLISESAGETRSFLHQQLRRTNSSTSLSAVDPKLLQIVKRITTSTPSLLIASASAGGNKASQQARSNNITAVTNLVLENHREYKRKDIGWVRSGVEGALSVLAAELAGDASGDTNSNRKRRAPTSIPIGGGSNISSSPSITESLPNNSAATQKKKRVESANEDTSLMDEDSDMDIIAEETNSINNNRHENSTTANSNEAPTISQTNSGGMLNASLRNNYKNVQREREREAAAATSADDGSTAPADDATNDISSSIIITATPLDGNEKSSTTQQGTKTPTTASVTTPKRKKKSSKKAPSSSRAQDHSDDNPYSTSTPSTLVLPSPRPTERYSNLGGMAPLLQQVRELIEYPLSRPELFLHLGVEPPRGVLLRGPPGCGKTHLAKAISGELNVSYFQVSAPELVGGVSGESELRVRTLFESAANYAPAIIFIDEIDAIAPKRGEGAGGGGKSMEKRIVAQLLTSMDSIHPKHNRNASAVIVLGATNRPDAMDPALRRAGRFDREIVLGAPDEAAREGILEVMTSQMRVEGTLDYKVLARKTPGFVGADLRSLTKEAAVIAIKRIFKLDLLGESGDSKAQDGKVLNDTAARDTPEDSSSNDINSIVPLTPEQLSPLYITMEDFLAAVPHVQPSAKREGFATSPDVSWDDIGALSSIREELTLSVLEPISHPEKFEALGLPLPAGVLLYGPPGCGKTLLAKAIANESGANFISVKGPELLDKYVGESERSVRVVFERARSSSPCIIFFDELDSLCPKRGSDSGGGGVSERVVNQLLTEMDGLDSRRSVFVIAATNRPELIDPAMLRPGRLDKLLYVPLPSPDDRYSILKALGVSVKLASDVNLHTIAHDSRANGFSGADCAALLREAGLAVLRDGILGKTTTPHADDADDESKDESLPLQITSSHFQYAFDHVLPSVSKKDQSRYDKLRDRMARARTRATTETETLAVPGVEDASDAEIGKVD